MFSVPNHNIFIDFLKGREQGESRKSTDTKQLHITICCYVMLHFMLCRVVSFVDFICLILNPDSLVECIALFRTGIGSLKPTHTSILRIRTYLILFEPLLRAVPARHSSDVLG